MRHPISTLVLFATVCLTCSRAGADAPRYNVTLLEDVKHKYFLEARAISDEGFVTGVSIEMARKGKPTRWHGFVYRHDKYNGVDAPAGATYSEAVGINTAGEIVENATSMGQPEQAYAWHDSALRKFGCVSGGACMVYAIGNSGTAVGSITLPDGQVVGAAWHKADGWSKPTLYKGFDRAVAVASNGDILLINGAQSYVASGTRTLRLGTLGGADAVATGLNNLGEIVGSSTTRTELTHAFLWQAGTITDVSKIPSLDKTAAVLSADAINDYGQIVGTVRADKFDTRAMLFENGHATNLNHLIPPGIITLDVARAINNRGQIIGQGHIGTHYVSYLLTPIAPLPAPPAPITAGNATPAGYKPAGPAQGTHMHHQDAGA